MPRDSPENANEGSVRWFTKKRALTVVFVCLVAVIVIDLSLVRIYDLVFKQFISISNKQALFAIVSAASIGLQIILLNLVRPSIMRKHTSLSLRLIFESTRIIQLVLSAMITFIILEVLLYSYYSTILLSLIIFISYSLCVAPLFAFVLQVLNTIGLKRNMIVVILFILALGSVTLNAAIAMIDSSLRLELRPPQTRLIIGGSMDTGRGLFNFLDDLYFVTFMISFVCTWIATSLILGYYRQKMGRIRFWLVAASPLLFFLAQFAYLLPTSYRVISDPFLVVSMVTLIVLLSKPLGGTMLGVAFWSLSRSLRTEHGIKTLLIISGFGFLLLFTCNQALLLSIAPYPPFGVTTVMAIGLGAYMTIVGLQGTSTILAQDAKLRQVIRKVAGSQLIDSLATGAIEKEIEGKVLGILKQHSSEMENQTGLQPSLSEEEARDYLKFVLEEINKKEK